VARELGEHRNTVTYRVRRAEELLGRRVSDRPLELMYALKLVAALGPAVLTDGEDATS
jgi:DNA-binding PucR family transcriptional regulator